MKFGFENGVKVQVTNSKLERIRSLAETSSKRLKTGASNSSCHHRVGSNEPTDDVAGTAKDLIAEGKVGHFSISEAGVQTIRRAHAVQQITAAPSKYSLFWRAPATELLPTLEELGGGVPPGPRSAGLLTGKIDENTKFDSKERPAVAARRKPRCDERRADRDRPRADRRICFHTETRGHPSL